MCLFNGLKVAENLGGRNFLKFSKIAKSMFESNMKSDGNKSGYMFSVCFISISHYPG